MQEQYSETFAMLRPGLGLKKCGILPYVVLPRSLLQLQCSLLRPTMALAFARQYHHKFNLQRTETLHSVGKHNGFVSRFLIRNLHHSDIKRSRYPFGDRSPFRAFRISPLVFFFAGVGTLTFFFLLLPFLLTFFLPLFLAGFSIFQFRKWKNNTLFEQLLNALKRSQIHLHSQTLNAMYVKSVSKFLEAAENPNTGVFGELFKGVDLKMRKDGIWPSEASLVEAERLTSFVESRVMEAIKNDEQGIRSFFLGQDVSNWIKEGYDFEFDAKSSRTLVRGFKREIIFMVIYPVYLKALNRPRKHLADISVAVLQGHMGDQKSFDFFLTQTRMIRDNALCKMVIVMTSVDSILPKQFIIVDGGQSEKFWSKYDVQNSSDGHTEYTIRGKD